ncbi:MAG TPA: UxaA family hydrolase [Thermoanaerobacterales bacterium]|jgi:altronate dehydratase large subunit|nr:UxaA family hydrolase [Thermoanaerobacterales bacterium]
MDKNNLKDIKWKGYLRKDKSKGVRNKVLIIYTVQCSEHVAKSIGAKFVGQDVDVVGFARHHSGSILDGIRIH